MKSKLCIYLACIWMLTALACSREDEDMETPIFSQNYPQLILFDDEGGGELEGSDELSIKITMADRYDPSGEELGGAIFPLEEDFLLNFQMDNLEGFDNIADYVLSCTALYEIDDCTTSVDEGVNILENYDPQTGTGQVRFPAGVEEIELVFELNPNLFDDELVNEERGFTISISAGSATEGINVLDLPFAYEVLDDNIIFGEWEGELNEESFAAFRALFGLVNEDLAELTAEEVEEIIWDFKYDELSIELVLTATEEVEECGEVETENIVIAIEAGYADLTTDALEGEIELEGEVEQEDGSEKEFVYVGEFSISDNSMEITLTGTFDDEETDEITLLLNK